MYMVALHCAGTRPDNAEMYIICTTVMYCTVYLYSMSLLSTGVSTVQYLCTMYSMSLLSTDVSTAQYVITVY